MCRHFLLYKHAIKRNYQFNRAYIYYLLQKNVSIKILLDVWKTGSFKNYFQESRMRMNMTCHYTSRRFPISLCECEPQYLWLFISNTVVQFFFFLFFLTTTVESRLKILTCTLEKFFTIVITCTLHEIVIKERQKSLRFAFISFLSPN